MRPRIALKDGVVRCFTTTRLSLTFSHRPMADLVELSSLDGPTRGVVAIGSR